MQRPSGGDNLRSQHEQQALWGLGKHQSICSHSQNQVRGLASITNQEEAGAYHLYVFCTYSIKITEHPGLVVMVCLGPLHSTTLITPAQSYINHYLVHFIQV